MKKYWALGLSALLAVGLAACGDDKAEPKTDAAETSAAEDKDAKNEASSEQTVTSVSYTHLTLPTMAVV